MTRGPIERYMAKNGYGVPLPHYWLNVFEDDDDAQLASLQNLVAGGHGEWHGGRERSEPDPSQVEPVNIQARDDAMRDMRNA